MVCVGPGISVSRYTGRQGRRQRVLSGMKRRLLIGIGLLALFGVCAFYSFHTDEARGDAGLFVYCGAGLRPAMEGLRSEFSERTGTPVKVTYAGSGCLLSMLAFARSGDLYMPGERFYVDQAAKDGHLMEDVTAAYFVAVVMVQEGNPKGIRSLADLARSDVRVGIGHPDTVACGLVAKKILEKAGIWDQVKANIDRQGACTATAMELSNALVLKALDAAINWDAMAYPVLDKTDILVIPREQNVEVPIPLATLAWSHDPKGAARFVEFARSEAGRQHFAKHGYHTSMEPYALPYYGDQVLQ